MPTTRLHFARFEFKYILSLQLRLELESELRYFLEFDPYVRSQPNHQYHVRSLYFEDPHNSCFYDKVNGLHSRSKFRVRTYTKDQKIATPQFLEIKGRFNNLVFKHRSPVNPQLCVCDEYGDSLVCKLLKAVDPSEVRHKFEYELYRKRLSPIALVDYTRRPYVSRFDPEFRLTFDSELQGTRTKSLFPNGGARQSRSLLPGYTVMEVKFRRQIPSWFHRLIQAYELRRVSVSKICHAMEALGIAEDL